MDLAAPFVQMWLTLGLGVDTAGYAPAQVSVGWDVLGTIAPVRAGLFGSLGIDEDDEGQDRMRIGFGFQGRWYLDRWLYAGMALELGSQERDEDGLLFVALDAVAGVPLTEGGRLALEVAAGVQGETELKINLFGEDESEPESRPTAHVAARVVVRL